MTREHDPDATGTDPGPVSPVGLAPTPWRERKPQAPLSPWHRHDGGARTRLKSAALGVLTLLAAGVQPTPPRAGLTICGLRATLAGLREARLIHQGQDGAWALTGAGAELQAKHPARVRRVGPQRLAALTALADGPATSRDLAREIATDRHAVARICRGLVGLGLARWSEESVEWSITANGRRYLARANDSRIDLGEP